MTIRHELPLCEKQGRSRSEDIKCFTPPPITVAQEGVLLLLLFVTVRSLALDFFRQDPVGRPKSGNKRQRARLAGDERALNAF